jgi:hypothetical protein
VLIGFIHTLDIVLSSSFHHFSCTLSEFRSQEEVEVIWSSNNKIGTAQQIYYLALEGYLNMPLYPASCRMLYGFCDFQLFIPLGTLSMRELAITE